MEKVLITGAAGYIGSHTLRVILESGRSVIALDDFSTGNRWAIPAEVPLFEGDFSDLGLLRNIHRESPFDTIIHFAAKTSVEESVRDPSLYYSENTAKTIRLLDACRVLSIKNFIYSSTCAVYGSVKSMKSDGVNEGTPVNPESPYGWSKYLSERCITDIAQSVGMKYSILRYFNVAGAHPDGSLGAENPKVRAMVTVAAEAAASMSPSLIINGDDYATRDGTCERDYIHVLDLAYAHLSALKRLESGGSSEVFNCGYGKAFSVKDIIATMSKVSGKEIKSTIGKRRSGDLESIFADSRKIRTLTDWLPRFDDISEICRSAYLWEISDREK
ncbi:MAG: UDP-glucose 4-epimerase GalE [Cryobacterium sp.]|nr:UDP-glucose 4-epimerase GalE [Oligoflexia bacterium]